MLRFNLAFSLVISFVFIAGATWFRISHNKPVPQSLSVESAQNDLAIYQGSPLDVYIGEGKNSTSTDKLNSTDLLGRQLFSDYLNLNSNHQVTPENINKLASSYADSILNLQTSSKIDRSKVTVTADSPEAIGKYGNAVFEIRTRYGKLVEKSLAQNKFTDASGPEFSKFMSSVSTIYKQVADEMQNLPVPASLVDNHVKLVNNYLSSSESARSLSNLSQDSLSAYAALNSYATTEEEEGNLLTNIQVALVSNGIVISNPL
jgi:hypothetical protein